MNDLTAEVSAIQRAKLEAAIADISERMKGPLSNADRAFMHADRKEMRERLASITAVTRAELDARDDRIFRADLIRERSHKHGG